MQQQTKPVSIQVELGEKEAEGVYSNMAIISFSPSEFFLDFARRMPGSPKAKVYARIVMTPPNLALLHKALEQNLENYQEKFGKIRLEGLPGEGRDIGFRAGGEGAPVGAEPPGAG